MLKFKYKEKQQTSTLFEKRLMDDVDKEFYVMNDSLHLLDGQILKMTLNHFHNLEDMPFDLDCVYYKFNREKTMFLKEREFSYMNLIAMDNHIRMGMIENLSKYGRLYINAKNQYMLNDDILSKISNLNLDDAHIVLFVDDESQSDEDWLRKCISKYSNLNFIIRKPSYFNNNKKILMRLANELNNLKYEDGTEANS